MRCGVVVTTFERPAALDRVLGALAAQTRRPDQVLVAEDGHDPSTAEVVRRRAPDLRCPLLHLTQPHHGFRAGRIRNAAVAASDCDYIVLLDGDMVPHPAFVEDHVALARAGHYSQGLRVPLDAAATRRQLAQGATPPRALDPGLGGMRRAYAWRSPRLAAGLRGIANAFVAVKSCNQGFWRSDLVAVNGFDEAFEGWGSEDKELCARLDNAGVRRQSLAFAAIAFHLEHAPAPRDRADANRARWQSTLRSGRRRCELGIDGHAARAPAESTAGEAPGALL